MRRIRFVLSLLAVAALVPFEALSAQATVGAQIEFKNRYLFAGLPFASGSVTHAQVDIGSGAVNVHGLLLYDHDASDLTEADIWGDYYLQANDDVGVYFGVGIYNFYFGDVIGWESTPELYAGAVFTAPLNPSVYIGHDLDLGDGTHVTFGVSESVPLGDTEYALGLAGALDYNNEYYVESSGFSFAAVSAEMQLPLGSISAVPFATLQFGIGDDFENDEVVGIRVLFSF